MKKIKTFFHPRQWLLAIVSAALIVLLSYTGRYAEWRQKLNSFVSTFYETKDNTSTAFRMKIYGDSYQLCLLIKQHLYQRHIVNPVIVFQPTAYFKEQHIVVAPPEPAVFYYYTGLRSVYINNPEAQRIATHFIRINNRNLEVIPITSPGLFTTLTDPYKRYLTPYRL